jgi:hypothetical protein
MKTHTIWPCLARNASWLRGPVACVYITLDNYDSDRDDEDLYENYSFFIRVPLSYTGQWVVERWTETGDHLKELFVVT